MPNYAPFAPFMTILRSMNVCSMTVKSAGAVCSGERARSGLNCGGTGLLITGYSSGLSTDKAGPQVRLECSAVVWSSGVSGHSVNSLSLIVSFNWQNKIALGEFRPSQ